MADPYYGQMIQCISHSDLDGMASAAVVVKKYGKKDTKVLYTNYGKELPPYVYGKGAKIIVTDYSLQPAEFDKMNDRGLGNNLVWIDHHSANFKPLEEKGYTYAGLRTDEACGAVLAWRYLFPGVEIPEALKLVSDYDLWKYEFGDRTRNFTAGIALFEQKALYRNCYIWDDLLSEDQARAKHRIDIICDIGAKIRHYTEERNRALCYDLVYTVDWQGYKIMIANTKQANSSFFDTVPNKNQVGALAVVQFSPDVMAHRVGIYSSDNIKPVLQIAQMFPGGGGHKCASGFQSKEYPFPVPLIKGDAEPMKMIIDNLHAKIFTARQDAIVNQSASKSDKITLNVALFKTKLGNRMILAANYPYISELMNTLPSTVDLIDRDTGEIYSAILGYCMTKFGLYRVGIKFTSSSAEVDTETFKQRLLQIIPDATDVYRENLGSLGSVYWFYTRKRPIDLPIV